jgi:hypothetical protein
MYTVTGMQVNHMRSCTDVTQITICIFRTAGAREH